ncbi:hypothetical protein N8490_01345 [bacterium]|nr:hypothetical protein [bacterium]
MVTGLLVGVDEACEELVIAHLASLCPNQADPLTLKLANLALAKTFPLPHAPVLQLWGLQTLDDLSKLPRQGLAERLGKELAQLHDIAHGKHHRLLKLYRAHDHYRITHRLHTTFPPALATPCNPIPK